MADLVIMMGVPGSGKSTWAKKMTGEFDTYISRDEIRFSLVKEDEEYFSRENEVLRTFFEEIDAAILTTKRYVYADATHLSPTGRRQLLSNLKNKPNRIYVVYVDVSLETAIERNAQRTGRALVPKDVVTRMYNSIKLPTKKEGINALFFVGEDGQVELSKTKIWVEEE